MNTKFVMALFAQVSVGTLLAFTMVAISVLILRYVPPEEVPVPSSLQASIDSVSLLYSSSSSPEDVEGQNPKDSIASGTESTKLLIGKVDDPVVHPLIPKLAACKFLFLLIYVGCSSLLVLAVLSTYASFC